MRRSIASLGSFPYNLPEWQVAKYGLDIFDRTLGASRPLYVHLIWVTDELKHVHTLVRALPSGQVSVIASELVESPADIGLPSEPLLWDVGSLDIHVPF